MAFADLTNDFVFRRIFATHPDIRRGLLNDLLDRQGDQAIEGIEYLPSEQLPLAVGAKLSILDVRCRDRAGTTFVVEMQLIHHPGFVNRAEVYQEALALANKATFTQEELDACEKVRDEIQQVLAIAEARWAEGRAAGEAEGFTKGKAAAVLAILAARTLHVSTEVRAQIEACNDSATLDTWILRATTVASAEEIIAPVSPSRS